MLLADDPIPTSRCCTHNKGIPVLPETFQHIISVTRSCWSCSVSVDPSGMRTEVRFAIYAIGGFAWDPSDDVSWGSCSNQGSPRFKESKEGSSSMRFISHNEADALWYFESFAEWSSVLGLSCKHLSGFKTEGIFVVCVPATYLDAGMIYIAERFAFLS